MKKIKIKGNDYVMVNERVLEFHKLYPNGSIKTDIIEMTERCITKTTVTPDVANPERCFTGIAYEMEGSSFINKTSFIEQCETSSTGRALGFLGIGVDESIATAEEVGNAIKQQSESVNLKDLEVKLPEIPKDNEATIDDIAKASNGVVVVDDMKLAFGKYKDMMISDLVKADSGIEYLKWLSTAELDFMKDENGKLQTDRVEAHNKCAAYYLAVNVEISF